MKKEFKLTEEDLKDFFSAIQPTMVIYGDGGVPLFRTPQEKANSEWRRLGDKYGFKWDTVTPINGKGQEYFLAEEKP